PDQPRRRGAVADHQPTRAVGDHDEDTGLARDAPAHVARARVDREDALAAVAGEHERVVRGGDRTVRALQVPDLRTGRLLDGDQADAVPVRRPAGEDHPVLQTHVRRAALVAPHLLTGRAEPGDGAAVGVLAQHQACAQRVVDREQHLVLRERRGPLADVHDHPALDELGPHLLADDERPRADRLTRREVQAGARERDQDPAPGRPTPTGAGRAAGPAIAAGGSRRSTSPVLGSSVTTWATSSPGASTQTTGETPWQVRSGSAKRHRSAPVARSSPARYRAG